MPEQDPKCLFCRISTHELPATLRYEDEEVIAIDDIHPKAPTHVLIIPKKHIVSLADVTPEDQDILGKLLLITSKLAKEFGIDQQGYRTVINTRSHAGQVVDHIHVHLLGGEPLGAMRA